MASLSRSVLCFSPASTASSRGGAGRRRRCRAAAPRPAQRSRSRHPGQHRRPGRTRPTRATARRRGRPRRRSRRPRRRVRGPARPGPTAAGAAPSGSGGRRPGRRPGRPRCRPTRGCGRGPRRAPRRSPRPGVRRRTGRGRRGRARGLLGRRRRSLGVRTRAAIRMFPPPGGARDGVLLPAVPPKTAGRRTSACDRRSRISGRPAQVDGSTDERPARSPFAPCALRRGVPRLRALDRPWSAFRPVVARQTRGGPCPRRRRPR